MGKKPDIDTVMVQDCIAAMQAMPADSVDMVFADPPYNLQLPGVQLTRPDESAVDAVLEDWDSFDSLKAYDDFSRAWLTEARRVLKPEGTLWVIGSYHNIYRIGALMQDLGFWILNDIIWRKANPMPNFRGRRFTNAHEILLWAAMENKTRYTFNYHSMKNLNDDVQMRSDWLLPICNGNERVKVAGNKAHPTQKPEALLARVLLAASNPGDVVLDPFAGTGTTAAVAKKLGRHFIAIERDGDYAALARARIKKAVPVKDPAHLAMSSRRDAPKIPFGMLVEQGVVQPGDLLVGRAEGHRARVRADGSLVAEAEGGATPPLDGSIHSLGARLLGRETCNGWDFWSLRRDDATIPIEDLRKQMRVRLGLVQ